MIVYGCGNADGNRHTHINLPIILAGGGGGTTEARPLRQVQVQADDQPVPAMADRLGVYGRRAVRRFDGPVGAVVKSLGVRRCDPISNMGADNLQARLSGESGM